MDEYVSEDGTFGVIVRALPGEIANVWERASDRDAWTFAGVYVRVPNPNDPDE